jgi:hypothetical protein
MDNIFEKLMESIFIESSLFLVKTAYICKEYDISTSIYIAHKPNSDYFIYINLPENALPFVSNDIQINLSSILKNDVGSMDVLNGELVTISSSFEKNATLIILTTIKDESLLKNVEKQAILIEEDPYFFKKQVLVVSPKDIDVIFSSFEKYKENYISYLQELISDPKAFNEFMNAKPLNLTNKAKEYCFAARLYEKLPFLVLSVQESDPEDLQKTIDNNLSETQRDLCEALLKLDIDNLSDWFTEIIKEENDA